MLEVRRSSWNNDSILMTGHQSSPRDGPRSVTASSFAFVVIQTHFFLNSGANPTVRNKNTRILHKKFQPQVNRLRQILTPSVGQIDEVGVLGLV